MADETYQNKYYNNFQPGSNAIVNQDPVYNGPVYQGCGQQATAQRFPLCREDNYLLRLYQFLVRKEWMATNTHSANFVYLMGGIERSPSIKPIEWTQTLQLLREMLESVFEPIIKRGVIKKSDIEKICPFCFSKDGKPVSLPAPKPKESAESTLLKNFLANLSEKS